MLWNRGQRRETSSGPLDLVFDDSALERVSGDAQQACRLDDVATLVQRVLAECSLGLGKPEGFKYDRHASRLEHFLQQHNFGAILFYHLGIILPETRSRRAFSLGKNERPTGAKHWSVRNLVFYQSTGTWLATLAIVTRASRILARCVPDLPTSRGRGTKAAACRYAPAT